MQSRAVFEALDQLNDALTPSAQMIIEIGTSQGAFTDVLRNHDISRDAAIHTFDVNTCSQINAGVQRRYVAHHLGDCFTSQRSAIIDLIDQPGRALVFCDGGDKPKEFVEFSKHLKSGDLIFAHDYVRTADLIGTDAVAPFWQHFEITYADIQDAVAVNDLAPFMAEQLQKAMWACFARFSAKR